MTFSLCSLSLFNNKFHIILEKLSYILSWPCTPIFFYLWNIYFLFLFPVYTPFVSLFGFTPCCYIDPWYTSPIILWFFYVVPFCSIFLNHLTLFKIFLCFIWVFFLSVTLIIMTSLSYFSSLFPNIIFFATWKETLWVGLVVLP